MRWRLRMSGNSSWSIGVVPLAKATDASYLATRGKVGITSTNDALQRLENVHGKIIDVVANTEARFVTFTIHGPTTYTIAQPIYEPKPFRLACSGYQQTVFELLPFPEEARSHSEGP